MFSNTIKFGTEGWRAINGEVFHDENVIRIAEAFVRFLQTSNLTHKQVAIGFDGRKDSAHYSQLFSQILSFHNISVLLSTKIIPTPVLSFAVKHHKCCAGVMITASHNPSQYNGIKFKASYGGPYLSDQITSIEELLRSTVEGNKNDILIQRIDFLPEYLEQLQSLIDMEALRLFAANHANQASVMIDSMGGAGQTILEDILIPLGWRAQTIFGTPEPYFYDRIPEPVAQNLDPLMYNTSVTDALLGISTDGDADRCGIVYEDGKWMSAQECILALVWHLHTNKNWNGSIIKSTTVTDKVRILGQRWEENVFEVNIGFKNITEVMLKEKFMFGGEESGGFGFMNHVPDRDGIVSGLMFCEMIAKGGKSLRSIMDAIYAVVGEIHYDRVDVPYDKSDRASLLPRLAAIQTSEHIAGFPIQSVRTYRDSEIVTGVKFILGNSRWLFIRKSLTEPVIRIYAEGQTKEEQSELLKLGRKMSMI